MRDPILAEALSRKGAVKRIAALCSVTPGAVCQWRRVPKRHVEVIAAYLGVDIDELRSDNSGTAPVPQCAVSNQIAQRGTA